MTAIAPPRPTTTISLWELSDSFAAIWPDLQAQFGVQLERSPDPDGWLRHPSAIRIVVAGGVEHRVLAALADLNGRLSAPTIVVGTKPDHRLAMALIHAGAAEYFALPQDLEQLRSWIGDQLEQIRQRKQQQTFAAREEAEYRLDGLIGSSAAFQHAISLAARVIPRPAITVLITGEIGTGKALLARAIHAHGPRRDAPFVDVDCAAMPERLLESELFGHERGAFTPATAAKPGLFEVADGGTIFLAEIGRMPPPLQGKLLRALEQRSIRRLGGTTTRSVDVRVIAATRDHLPDAVRRGEFRDDLYHRLNVFPVALPPLRSRDDDVVLLAEHFLARFATDHQAACPPLSQAAEARLRDHPWPGNVSELRNVIERSLMVRRDGEIGPEDLAFRPQDSEWNAADVPFAGTMRELMRAAARATVERCRGNKSEAARRLGISRTRLLRLLDPKAAARLSLTEDE
ncbi:MAG: sigma-54 interaction domain-containing protein [Gemmatimonadales bacterium]